MRLILVLMVCVFDVACGLFVCLMLALLVCVFAVCFGSLCA